MGFAEQLDGATRRNESLICVGLDPDLGKFPAHLRSLPAAEAIVRFNAAIVAATKDRVCAYKPNLGFYVAYGEAGIAALVETRRMIPAEIPVVLDCKVGDMDNTAAAYARGYFNEWDFDAITANPYMGEDSLAPLFGYAEKGVLVLCKTSNPGSGDLQDVVVRQEGGDGRLYLTMADRVARWRERYPATIGLVVGATYPNELATVRKRCPGAPILVPGVGAQGGGVSAVVAAGVDAWGAGLMVSVSRAAIYASADEDFAERCAAVVEGLRGEANQALGVRR